MFGNKRFKAIEERLAKLEQFEKSVSTICDNYFATNEKRDLSFSTGCSADKFYHFVMSVDEKLKMLGKIEKENAELRKENSELNVTIIGYEQDVEYLKEKLEKAKTATAKGGKK